MKKNLKKALSAVIALAVAVSMIPATFAAKLTLTDVAETAAYATAVNTLVALDVINGYEDGTFQPDKRITRAEATKIVVAVLNKISVAEGMKGSTVFTDVEGRHEWATGFINAGVAEGFIKGMGDNTFGPDLDVTYAQIVTMLVRILGYEEYATYMGGYPNGYLSIANSEGVTKGVSANANDPATRAQVAMLAYNALQTPIVANTGMVYSSSAGGFVPNISKMDGTGDNKYKTLLTENFDAYLVEGYVMSTSKSDSTLKSDEVTFAIAKSEKYDNDDFTSFENKTYTTADTAFAANQSMKVKVGDTDAINYDGSYAQAIIKVEDNSDNVFISFNPSSGKNTVVTYAASLIDTDELDKDANDQYTLYKTTNSVTEKVNYVEYFPSDSATKSTKYNLSKDSSGDLTVALYVNGVLVSKDKNDTDLRALLADYVLNNNVGDVQLVDTYKTDNYYDKIYVNYYATAQVSAVNVASGKVTLSDTIAKTAGGTSSITLDDEDDDLTYHIYYNGEEIKLSDLKVDDVISIAYDVTGNLNNSNFYDIYVSRDVKGSSKLTSKNATDKVLKFNGEVYELVANYSDVESEYEVGSEYDLYIDAFNRIFKQETAETADKYAIVDRYLISNSDDEYKIYLYTAEGVSKNYILDAAKAEILQDGTQLIKGSASNKTALRNTVIGLVYKADKTTKKDVWDRVVKYKVSSSTGYVTYVDFITSSRNAASGATFNARTNALGSIKMDSSTKIINAIDYVDGGYSKVADLSVASLSNFADSKDYRAYAFGKRSSNSIDPFVVVTEGAKAYDENTRFAVVSNSPSEGEDDAGDTVYTVPVFYKGAENDEEQIINVTDDVSRDFVLGLEVGDIVVFKTNSKGKIDELYKISNWGDISDYDAIVTKSIANQDQFINLSSDLLADSDNWTKDWTKVKEEEVTILYGPILARSSKNLTLGRINNSDKTVTDGDTTYEFKGYTDQNDSADYVDISLTSETNVYQYDYSASTKNRLTVINAGSVPFTQFNKSYVYNDVIAWGDVKKTVGTEAPVTLSDNTNTEIANFAYVLVADGEVLDMLVLAAK